MRADRRAMDERRGVSSPFALKSLNGRRRIRRRTGDGVALLPNDRYGAHLLIIAIGILLFCAADAYNTLLLLGVGGTELNPIMNVLIREDARLFVLCKLALTGLGLLMLVGYEYQRIWKRIRVSHLLYLVFTGYLLLIGYQSVLMPEELPGLVLR